MQIKVKSNYWSDYHRASLYRAAVKVKRRFPNRTDIDIHELVNVGWLSYARRRDESEVKYMSRFVRFEMISWIWNRHLSINQSSMLKVNTASSIDDHQIVDRLQKSIMPVPFFEIKEECDFVLTFIHDELDRKLITEHYLQGIQQKDLATKYGIKKSTVQCMIARILRQTKKAYLERV